MTFNVLELH
jgi:hypothetical protein